MLIAKTWCKKSTRTFRKDFPGFLHEYHEVYFLYMGWFPSEEYLMWQGMDWPLLSPTVDSFGKFMRSLYEHQLILEKQFCKGSTALFLSLQLLYHKMKINSE